MEVGNTHSGYYTRL